MEDKKKGNAAQAAVEADEFAGRKRQLGNSFWGIVIKIAAIILSLFHLYTAGFGSLPMIQQRSFHLALVLFLVYLTFPGSKRFSRKKMNPIDAILAVVACASSLYVFFRFDIISAHAGILSQMDLVVGAIVIIVVLEGVRRVSGNVLLCMMIIALLYCKFGYVFPDFFRHNGMTVRRIIQFMVWSGEGIYGTVLGVSSTYLFVFVLFGAVLDKTGLAQVINDLALAVAGGLRGGPAKVAILASGCMGTISGSAVANVATTGTITIPMMKKLGYQPAFAACVEAIASTGGMIMPPIMGAAAMIMAEFLGISYVTIMKAALIPALLYYFACWMVVDFEARRLNLTHLSKDQLPKIGELLKKRGYLLIPIVALIGLMIAGKTPLFASFWSIVIAVIVSSFSKETRLTPKKAVEALEDAGMLAIPVANTCAAVGIMVGMTGATGLGLVLGDGLIKLAGGNFYLTLIFTTITCLLLGMGLPSTACYIVVATIAAPALLKFGISGIPVHMFVFYFGILSVITPPVCTASYTAAGIAGEEPNKVGYMAFRLALSGFLIPFVFITSPELLLIDPTFFGVAGKLITACLGVIAMASMAVGYFRAPMKIWERLAMLIGGVCLMDGGLVTDIAGFVIMAVVVVLNLKRAKSRKEATETSVNE